MRVGVLKSLMKMMVFTMLLASGHGAAGKDKSIPPEDLVYCTVCHGVNLMGNALLKAPRLSGMASWNVKYQLQSFRNRWRGVHEYDLAGLEMMPMAMSLTEKQVDDAAAFVASTRSPAPPKTIKGNVVQGKMLYQGCMACHGSEGQGIEALRGSPLAGLNDWYVKQQIENYQNDLRGISADDIYGAQMRAASKVLTDQQDILDVVSYIATLKQVTQ